jgi:hypothetical protein
MTLLANPAVNTALITFLVVALGLLSAVMLRLTASVTASGGELARLRQQVGGAVKRNITLPGGAGILPAWDQLHDPLPDGSLPPLRVNECGEECVAEVVYWVHGVEVSADAIRAAAISLAGGALTNAADLVAMLARCNVRAVAEVPQTAVIEKFLLNVVLARRLVIVLGDWVSKSVPHWVIVYNASPNGVTVSDPWGGRRYNIAWPDFKRLYLGAVVEVTSTPDLATTN